MKFTDQNGKPVYITKSGVILAAWERGKDEPAGTTITIVGTAHRVTESLDDVAEEFGEEVEKPASPKK